MVERPQARWWSSTRRHGGDRAPEGAVVVPRCRLQNIWEPVAFIDRGSFLSAATTSYELSCCGIFRSYDWNREATQDWRHPRRAQCTDCIAATCDVLNLQCPVVAAESHSQEHLAPRQPRHRAVYVTTIVKIFLIRLFLAF